MVNYYTLKGVLLHPCKGVILHAPTRKGYGHTTRGVNYTTIKESVEYPGFHTVVTSLSLRCYAPFSRKGNSCAGKVILPHYEILPFSAFIF